MASSSARSLPSPRSWLARLDDELHVVDPDGGRVRGASSITLGAVLGAVLAALVAPLAALPSSAPMLAGTLAMIAGSVVTETTPAEERRTFALLFVPLTVGLAVGILLATQPVASLVAFVAVAFGAVMLQRLGPRGTASGSILFNAYFFALFFRVTPSEALGIFETGWIAFGAAALVRFAFHLERGSVAFRRLRRALPILGTRVLAAHRLLLRDGDTRPGARRRALQRLNEAALLLEDHFDRSPLIAAMQADTKRRAFELELAAERVSANVLALSRGEAIPAACREALERAIASTEHVLSGAADDGDRARAIGAARLAVRGQPRIELAVARLGDSLDALLRASHSTFQPAASAAMSKPPDAPKLAPPPEGLHTTTRLAIQVSIATALAVAVGRAISEERWFWAAVAAYLVIAPATTRGEILIRAWRRTLGTTIGVAIGLVLALVVSGHSRIELALLFACVFLAMFSRKSSYTWVVLWLTTGLALLYELTGRYSMGLLALRFEETAAGAGIGALCAALVLPSHTGTRLETTLARFATLLGDDLDDLVRALSEHQGASRSRVRAIDRALVEVRAAAEPLTRAGYRLGAATSDLVRACSALAFYARQLAMPGLLAQLDGARPELTQVLAGLAQNSRQIATLVTTRERQAAAPVPLEALRARADRDRASDRPADLDLALLCTERLSLTLEAMRIALTK